jgi:hypothetical protein
LKKVKLILLSLLFFVLFGGSRAMAIDLYGFGSYWDKEDAEGTWGGGIGISLPFITERLRIDGRAYFFEDSNLGHADLSVTPFDLGLQVHILPNATLDPYLLGGISYIYADSNRIDVDSSFGGYLGFGLDWELGSPLIKIFGEILYRASELESSFDDIDVSGIATNIGLKIHL